MFTVDAPLIGKYQNGNYKVYIFADGTKVRINGGDFFSAAFPENVDLKITNKCDMSPLCQYCHENSVADGKHGDILNNPILKTLHPYTELAIGGGNPFLHPDFEAFLKQMYEQKVICNVTVNAQQWTDKITEYQARGLLHGVGVSITSMPDKATLEHLQQANVVAHVIVGVVTPEILDKLATIHPKLLLLGYKLVGRGDAYYSKHSTPVDDKLEACQSYIRKNRNRFAVVSFDNLALEQLRVKDWVEPEEWESFYMGNDGQHTMYIDAVENSFAISSTHERIPISPEIRSIDGLFSIVKRMVM